MCDDVECGGGSAERVCRVSVQNISANALACMCRLYVHEDYCRSTVVVQGQCPEHDLYIQCTVVSRRVPLSLIVLLLVVAPV